MFVPQSLVFTLFVTVPFKSLGMIIHVTPSCYEALGGLECTLQPCATQFNEADKYLGTSGRLSNTTAIHHLHTCKCKTPGKLMIFTASVSI